MMVDLFFYDSYLNFLNKTECNSSSATPTILSMGVGSGALHMSLLHYFPCAIVSSVDISESIVKVAIEDFAFSDPLCGLTRLEHHTNDLEEARGQSSTDNEFGSSVNVNSNNSEDTLLWSLQPTSINLSTSNSFGSFSSGVNNDEQQQQCRSYVVISDAWDYLDFIGSARSIAHSQDRLVIAQQQTLFDVIVFDVYDHQDWDGTIDQGVSNAFVERAAHTNTLINIRKVLSSHGGVALFYLHRDGTSKRYFRNIVEVFGQQQVALLTVSSNAVIIVAGKNLFRTASEEVDGDTKGYLEHPCSYGNASIYKFADWVVVNGQRHNFDSYIKHTHKYSLDCDYF
jgi:hypothetical protein